MPSNSPPPDNHGQKGFSLVELMVAIALGLVLVAGLATLFADSSRAGGELNKSVRQIENGRYAADILSEDLSMAGFYGDLTPTGVNYANGAVCDTSVTPPASGLGWNNATLSVPTAITGLSAVDIAALSPNCLANYKTGTPAIVIRRLDPTLVVPGAASNGQVYLQTSNCETDPTATRFVISDTATSFTLRNIDCISINLVRKFLTRIYYVASCSDCPNDSIPTLKRAELRGNQMTIAPLAEGIEDLGFDYAFDTNGDGMADVYQAGLLGTGAVPTNNWANVVGVRLHLLTRSTESSADFDDGGRTYDLGLLGVRGPFSDSFKRKAYVVTTRLNNVAGPREQP